MFCSYQGANGGFVRIWSPGAVGCEVEECKKKAATLRRQTAPRRGKTLEAAGRDIEMQGLGRTADWLWKAWVPYLQNNSWCAGPHKATHIYIFAKYFPTVPFCASDICTLSSRDISTYLLLIQHCDALCLDLCQIFDASKRFLYYSTFLFSIWHSLLVVIILIGDSL